MPRLAVVALLGCLAVPAEASNPNRIQKERSRTRETVEPPLARPMPIPQPPAPEPMLNDKVAEAVASPQHALLRYVCDRFVFVGESEELRQARAEFHRFWMNNQPAVLTYQR